MPFTLDQLLNMSWLDDEQAVKDVKKAGPAVGKDFGLIEFKPG